jgi:hypothetical protein
MSKESWSQELSDLTFQFRSCLVSYEFKEYTQSHQLGVKHFDLTRIVHISYKSEIEAFLAIKEIDERNLQLIQDHIDGVECF